jgi:hypothetical protein
MRTAGAMRGGMRKATHEVRWHNRKQGASCGGREAGVKITRVDHNLINDELGISLRWGLIQ